MGRNLWRLFCPNLKIESSKLILENTSEITLTVSGCPTGGVLTWADDATITSAQRKLQVTPPKTFSFHQGLRHETLMALV